MATKTSKYSATFADGTTITRKTERSYGVAWRATWAGTTQDGKPLVRSETGFSITADKVAAFQPKTRHICQSMSSAERAKRRAENAAYLAQVGYKVEIVPTVLIS